MAWSATLKPLKTGHFGTVKSRQTASVVTGRPLDVIDATGVYYIHTDHLGTPRVVSDGNGTLVWRWVSTLFGLGAPEGDPDGDGRRFTLNLRFPGQYFDAETGLHYNYFRYYDPTLGRYITSDPIGLDGGLNTYLYAKGNTNQYLDPTGLHYMQDGFGNYVPHTHSYPAPCASCNVDRQPNPRGMLDPYSPDHYRLPSCISCNEKFSSCLAGTGADITACEICAVTRARDRAACRACLQGATGALACFLEHCAEARRGVDGECRPERCNNER